MEQYNVTGMSCAACSSQSGEGGIQGSGGDILFGQSADQLHGSGGNCTVQVRSSRQYRMQVMEHP